MRPVLLLILFLLLPACDKLPEGWSETSTGMVIDVDSDDAEMNQAMADARDSLGLFLAKLENRVGVSEMLIKTYLADEIGQEDGEYVWVRDLTFQDKWFTGTLASDPLRLTKYELGDELRFRVSAVADWMYVDSGKVHGAFTVRLLRSRMTEEERTRHDRGYEYSFD